MDAVIEINEKSTVDLKKSAVVKCKVCKRILKNEHYKQLGMGKICASKIGITITISKKSSKSGKYTISSVPVTYNEQQLEIQFLYADMECAMQK